MWVRSGCLEKRDCREVIFFQSFRDVRLLCGRPPLLSLRSSRFLLEEKIIDLGSGDVIQDYAAHEKAVWSLDLRPDAKGLVTGSADRSVSC